MSSRRAAVKPVPKPEPKPRPSAEELDKAFEVLDAYFLHFYQLLYFSSPKLTEPGNGRGRPFNLKRSVEHSHCIQVECQPWSGRRAEFDFLITPDMTDAAVVTKCHAILDAINNSKKKVHDMACCPLAEHHPCVCAYAFTCIIHGERHIGTHD